MPRNIIHTYGDFISGKTENSVTRAGKSLQNTKTLQNTAED